MTTAPAPAPAIQSCAPAAVGDSSAAHAPAPAVVATSNEANGVCGSGAPAAPAPAVMPRRCGVGEAALLRLRHESWGVDRLPFRLPMPPMPHRDVALDEI
jgi:hypothetical protein